MGEGERKGLISVRSISQLKGKAWDDFILNFTWEHPCGLGLYVYCSHGVRVGLSRWHRTRDCRQVSLGKPSPLTSRRPTWAGWNVTVGDRKPGPASEVEHWKMVKLCRIPCGCCWAHRKYSQCYRYSGWTHLTQKYLFLESTLALSLWQSAGSYLLYSWFKLKLLRIMG